MASSGDFGYDYIHCEFSVLKGQTLVLVDRIENDQIHFITGDGNHYVLTHMQYCCESVEIDDIHGDLDDLIGSPLLVADEITSRDTIRTPAEEGDALMAIVRMQQLLEPPPVYDSSAGDSDSETWTFYRLQTIKGSVTIRWYGTSNGYYSESVDLIQIAGHQKKE